MILIDGYNLMHATRFQPVRGSNPTELRRKREGLLRFLARHFPPSRGERLVIVFDAQDPPKHLGDTFDWDDLRVLFARNHASADELLVELIRADSAPKKLLVVSSDHQIQKAARRRRARAIDSDVWFDGLLSAESTAHLSRLEPPKGEGDHRNSPHFDADVSFDTWTSQDWLRFFEENPCEEGQDQGQDQVTGSSKVDDSISGPATQIDSGQVKPSAKSIDPFPPGYFDDIEYEI